MMRMGTLGYYYADAAVEVLEPDYIKDLAVIRKSPPLSPYFNAVPPGTNQSRVVGGEATGSRAPPSSATGTATAAHQGMIERCVVVQRQRDGYGLTVTGDHPVFVYTVRPDGAAFCAGVRKGDRILKVNGMPVTSQNYLEVVRMISGGQCVALTLLGKPPDHIEYDYSEAPELPPKTLFRGTDHLKNIATDSSQYLPSPALSSEERAFNRRDMIHRMLEDEKRNIEDLRTSCRSTEKQGQIGLALQRIDTLQSQLVNRSSDSLYMNSPAREPLLPLSGGSAGSAFDNDRDSIDEEMTPLDAGIPFTSIVELKARPAHLALFIQYLVAQGNHSALFFYLITDAYQTAAASPKELRRWALEIFSIFLVPNAPLCINNIDQSILQPIDKLLANTVKEVSEHDGERFRRAFTSARQRALSDVTEGLTEFRAKKDLAGVASYDAAQLHHATKGDTNLEKKVGENKLMKQLEVLLGSVNGDLETCERNTQATIWGIATIVKVVLAIKASSSAWEKMLDKTPTFLARDKSSKFATKMKSAAKKNIQAKGHMLSLKEVQVVHYCYQCKDPIGGVGAQGYFCNNCDVVVHKGCTGALADACYPATQKRATKSKTKAKDEDGGGSDEQGTSRGHRHEHGVKSTSSDSGIRGDLTDRTVIRSQSMKSRLSQITQSTASTEDVLRAIPRGRSALSWGPLMDLRPAPEMDDASTSSRGRNRSMESSATYATNVTGVGAASAVTVATTPGGAAGSLKDAISVSGLSSSVNEEELKLALAIQNAEEEEHDAELAVMTDIPPLESIMSWDIIKHMKPKDKKLREIFLELFHTEATHVRNLKVIKIRFADPVRIAGIVSPDVIWLIFANLDEVLQIHQEMNARFQSVLEEWKKNPMKQTIFTEIGGIMAEFFEGEKAERLKQATSLFCQHQQHALDILRARSTPQPSRKDDSFSSFLAKAETHSMCRKLQLKDMLPVEMQRLVKYPMLLETAAKYTAEESEEQEELLRVMRACKKILSAVNTAKRTAENLRRLEDLQRRMDTTPFDKENSGNDYASLDLTKYHLIHDGPLTLRYTRGKQLEVHAILLEEILVLLTRVGDSGKLQLKSIENTKVPKHEKIVGMPQQTGVGDAKYSPIFSLFPMMVKEKANDKRCMFVLPNPNPDGRPGGIIFELMASSHTERKTWLKLMSDQIEYIKKQPTEGIEPFRFEMGTSNGDGDGNDRVQILTHPRLVNANEITIQQPTVLEHAQPILTPAERLKRNDTLIFQALLDKLTILAAYLPGDKRGREECLEKLTELLGGLAVADLKQRDPKELAMSAIVHGNRLLDSINNSMHAERESEDGSMLTLAVDEADRNLPSVPCYKLTAIAAPLMNHIKALMQVVQNQEQEITTLKQQLYIYKEREESGGHTLSVSEETLTDTSNIDGERKLLTKRHHRDRAPSIPPVPPPNF